MTPWVVLVLLGLARGQEPPPLDLAASNPQEATAAEQVASPQDAPAPDRQAREAEIYQRLLGPSAEPVPQPTPPIQTVPVRLSGWGWLVAVVALLAGAWLIKRGLEKRPPKAGSIQLVSQTAIGRSASLAVVRVEDEYGAFRRLLIGVGAGTPALVADLGISGDENDDGEEEEQTPEFMKDRPLMDRLERERRLLEATSPDTQEDEDPAGVPDFIHDLLREKNRTGASGSARPTRGRRTARRPGRRGP